MFKMVPSLLQEGSGDAGDVREGGLRVKGHHGLQGAVHVQPLHIHQHVVANAEQRRWGGRNSGM